METGWILGERNQNGFDGGEESDLGSFFFQLMVRIYYVWPNDLDSPL